MTSTAPKLPDAERDVLACLNQLGEATVKELQEALQSVRRMEAASVLTLLKRMEDKSLVTKRKADRGKAFVFRPTENSAVACRGLMRELFQRVFGGDTMAFMASFFETEKPTAQEIEQLEKLLEDLKRRNENSSVAGDKDE
ncbi:MAG: BlaI/MecI/CopY family transcriptional regulator [Planctomycetaceae bacterium]